MRAGRLSHPYSLALMAHRPLLSPRKQSSRLFLVMEYMDGGSLEDLVKAGGCKDEDFLADVAYNVLRVRSCLHIHICLPKSWC